MKRVSFRVAKALKEAGYPQGPEEYVYRSNGEIYIFESEFEHIPDYCCDAPTYLEVWLWLWREKKIWIEILNFSGSFLAYINKKPFGELVYNDQEKAIISAIEYLVDNNLIK